jgi:hypothetical protein
MKPYELDRSHPWQLKKLDANGDLNDRRGGIRRQASPD